MLGARHCVDVCQEEFLYGELRIMVTLVVLALLLVLWVVLWARQRRRKRRLYAPRHAKNQRKEPPHVESHAPRHAGRSERSGLPPYVRRDRPSAAGAGNSFGVRGDVGGFPCPSCSAPVYPRSEPVICRQCGVAADNGRPPEEHCWDEGWCDCQHKPVGSLISRDDELASTWLDVVLSRVPQVGPVTVR